MAFNFKTATPDTSFPAGGFIFGCDSQAATTPSAYADSIVAAAIELIKGAYLTTMRTSNSATENGAAITADAIAAQGKKIIVPWGNYPYGGGSVGTGACDITSSEAAAVHIEFMPGAKLTCNTSGKNSTNAFFWFREGVIASITGGEFDGGAIAEICIRTTDVSATPGCELTVKGAKIHNFGWTTADSATASSAGTLGILLANGKRLVVEDCQFSNCRSRENGTYGDQPGKCTFIQVFNASSGQQNASTYYINNCDFDAGVEANEADDYDAVHFLQQSSLATIQGVVSNCRSKFHGKSRRWGKFQGGRHKVYGCYVEPTSTWTKTTAGATAITLTGATAASPAVFTVGSAHGIPTGTYVEFPALAGGTWSTLVGSEWRCIPASSTTFNIYGPVSDLDTSGLGTYTANTGRVTRVDGQGQTLIITAATAANPGVFTTRYGVSTLPHGFTDKTTVRLSSMAGGTWSTLNGTEFMVVPLSSTTFSLKNMGILDSSGLGTWSSGTVQRVNGTSEEGMAGIDWAGSNDGRLDIDDCWFDFSGFKNGIVQSTGDGSTLVIKNSAIFGNRYDSNRLIPDSGSPEVAITNGIVFSDLDDLDSGVFNCDIFGWGRSVFVQGRNNKISNNRFYDPRVHWIQTGSTVRSGLIVCDNEVFTRTPYSLNASADGVTADFARCSEIRNWTDVNISRNRLVNDGNSISGTPLHGTGFIQFIVNGVTGVALDNVAPHPALPIKYTSGVAKINQVAGTSAAGAITQNSLGGFITTESLTTAAGATYTLTVTNSQVAAGDHIDVEIAGGSNSAGIAVKGRVTPAAGSFAIQVMNLHASAAFNGTLILSYSVKKG